MAPSRLGAGKRMLTYLARRVVTAALTLLASTFGVAMLVHVVPGDPVMMMMAQNSAATPEQIANMRHQLGLDLPLWQQYLHYMGKLLSGDLGRSIFGSEPVSKLLIE